MYAYLLAENVKKLNQQDLIQLLEIFNKRKNLAPTIIFEPCSGHVFITDAKPFFDGYKYMEKITYNGKYINTTVRKGLISTRIEYHFYMHNKVIVHYLISNHVNYNDLCRQKIMSRNRLFNFYGDRKYYDETEEY
ncbi:hypothetical protein COBT_002888, partial [Conglomerata obtusa]